MYGCHQVHDAYIELANLLVENDPQAAVDVYSRFPLKPVNEQTFDDAFITGEIVHILMKQELYEHPQLAPNLIAYGKVMGLSKFICGRKILRLYSKHAQVCFSLKYFLPYFSQLYQFEFNSFFFPPLFKGCIEKYIEVLDGKFMTKLLKTVYAGIHNKSVEDKDLQEFFKFKCWI